MTSLILPMAVAKNSMRSVYAFAPFPRPLLEDFLACRYQVDSTCAVFRTAIIARTRAGCGDCSDCHTVPSNSGTEVESRIVFLCSTELAARKHRSCAVRFPHRTQTKPSKREDGQKPYTHSRSCKGLGKLSSEGWFFDADISAAHPLGGPQERI